jgi:hypothetical protein
LGTQKSTCCSRTSFATPIFSSHVMWSIRQQPGHAIERHLTVPYYKHFLEN